MMKYNIIVLALHLLLIISVKASNATNPFTVANAQASYLDIIKIKPPKIFDKHKKLDFISVSKELKNKLSIYAKKNNIKLKGYYAIAFDDEKILIFTRILKTENAYKGFFITEKSFLNISMIEKEDNYLKAEIDVKYRYDKFGDFEYSFFNLTGNILFVDDIYTSSSNSNGMYFAIYKL